MAISVTLAMRIAICNSVSGTNWMQRYTRLWDSRS